MRVFKNGNTSYCVTIPKEMVKDKNIHVGDDCIFRKDALGRYYLNTPEDQKKEADIEVAYLTEQIRKRTDEKLKQTEGSRA